MGILALCKVMFSRIKPLVFTHLQWLGGKPAEDVLGKLCRGSIGIKEKIMVRIIPVSSLGARTDKGDTGKRTHCVA